MPESYDRWIHHWNTAEQDTRPIRVRRPKPRPKRTLAKRYGTSPDRLFVDRLERSLDATAAQVA